MSEQQKEEEETLKHEHVVTSVSEHHVTSVVTSVPRVRALEEREWKTGLCDCCVDKKQACVTCLCPCCVACKLARNLGEKLSCCTVMCVPGGLTALRTKMRMMYGLKGSIFCDCLITEFCLPCALCQMDREMKHLGID